MLALGTIVICPACCYFEYFAHRYATGMRLIERAQNQALILLLFGSTLGVRLLVVAYRPQLRERLAAGAFRGLLGPVGLPACLASLVDRLAQPELNGVSAARAMAGPVSRTGERAPIGTPS